MGVHDRERPSDCRLHIGGDVDRLGDYVPRGFLKVIQVQETPVISETASGRVELAKWLTRPDHPLTSRVMVNRVWHHLFGRGIVETVDNFGTMGSRPSHIELLDHLALQFVEDGWSVKRLIRAIVTSRVYQLSSESDEGNEEMDADNRLVWRMPLRRLEAEAIRDAILSVSGQLRTDSPNSSLVQDIPIAQIGRGRVTMPDVSEFGNRSVYWPIVRSRLPNFLSTFDFPEPSEVKGDRDITTVPTQALFMMNSPMIQYHSRLAAQRLLSDHLGQGGWSRRRLIEEAYILTLSRWPTEEQVRRVVRYMRESRSLSNDRPRQIVLKSVTDLIHVLMASTEFRYR